MQSDINVNSTVASLPEKSGTTDSDRSYIPTLDGWRALAVIIVMGGHCRLMLMNSGSKAAQSVATLFSSGGYGVDIFFALSGYLICTLLLRERQRTGTINISRFYLRRAFRILPPLILYLSCIGVLSGLMILPNIEAPEFLSVLFFYRNYAFGTWYTQHFWSLAVEEQFYAVVPICLRIAKFEWAVRGASVLIAACIAIRWFELSSPRFAGQFRELRTETHCDGLLWGAMLAFALHNVVTREWLRKRLTGWVFAVTMVLTPLLLFQFPSHIFRRTLVAMVVPILIGHTVLHSKALMGRFLENPVLRWLGRLSYSLYLWQMLFLVEDDRPLGPVQQFPLNLVFPLLCATISYYYIEKPMIRLGHRLAGSPGAKSTGRFD